MYRSSADREEVLDEFRHSDDSILIAPSFERGVDLPHDLCRLILIVKVPFPYLGDKQVSARLYRKGGKQWYIVETIRSIVQMSGRGMRSEDDWCDTYILDRQFSRVYREWKRLFPAWWREAVVMDMNRPRKEVTR